MRIGLIGCGLISNKRAAVIPPEHQIKIAADIDLPRAQSFAQKFNTSSTQAWQKVIDADVDLIMIATPHDQLAKITLAALEAKKHVLVEKPAGMTAAELQPIIHVADKNQKFVKVGFNHRFHPALMKAHHIVQNGEIGPLLYIRGIYGHGGRLGYEKEWRCQPHISGGGELIDQGSHLIDLSRWFLGDLTLHYAATPTYYWNIPVEDNCFLALQSSTQQMAWLHASWMEWKNQFVYEIYGRDGKLRIEGLGGSYGVERLTLYRMLPTMGPPETTCWEFPFTDRSWELEYQDFIQAIAQNRQPNGNIHDAFAMLKIIDSAYARKAS